MDTHDLRRKERKKEISLPQFCNIFPSIRRHDYISEHYPGSEMQTWNLKSSWAEQASFLFSDLRKILRNTPWTIFVIPQIGKFCETYFILNLTKYVGSVFRNWSVAESTSSLTTASLVIFLVFLSLISYCYFGMRKMNNIFGILLHILPFFSDFKLQKSYTQLIDTLGLTIIYLFKAFLATLSTLSFQNIHICDATYPDLFLFFFRIHNNNCVL